MTISMDNFYYICDTGHDEMNDNEYRELLLQLVILSALKLIVWLTEPNLNTTDFQYSLLTPDD